MPHGSVERNWTLVLAPLTLASVWAAYAASSNSYEGIGDTIVQLRVFRTSGVITLSRTVALRCAKRIAYKASNLQAGDE